MTEFFKVDCQPAPPDSGRLNIRQLTMQILVVVPVLVLLFAQSLFAQSPDEISHEKALRILGISRHAAENGMQNLSLRAAREAMRNGPPVLLNDEPGGERLPDAERRLRSDSEIVAELQILTDLWHAKEFDRAEIYETLQEIVLPKAHPLEVFSYHAVGTHSAGSLLIRESIELGRFNELREILESRYADSLSKTSAWHLLLQLSLQEKHSGDARKYLTAFTAELASRADSTEIHFICLTLLQAFGDPSLRDAVLPAMESALDRFVQASISSSNETELQAAILLLHSRLKRGDQESALHCLDLADILAQRQYSEGTQLSLLIDHHTRVADLLLQFGMKEQAATRLHEIITYETDSETEGARAVSRVMSLVPFLGWLPAKERFPVLRYCYFGNNRSTPATPLLMFLNSERPPDVFGAMLPEGSPRGIEHREADAVHAKATETVMNSVVSSAVMLIDAAIEAGEAGRLKTDLQTLQTAGKQGASHLLAILFIKNGDGEAAADAVDEIRKNLQQDVQQSKARGRNLALDLVVAMQATELVETRSAGIEMLDTIRRITEVSNLNDISDASLARTYVLAAESGSATELFRKSTPKLWTPAQPPNLNHSQNTDMRQVWFAHDGMISHQSKEASDSLYFPWPLGGSFEFSVSGFHDALHSAGTGFDGLTQEMLTDSRSYAVAGVGNNNTLRRLLQFNMPGDYARSTVRVTPTRLTFLVNGHPVYQEQRDTPNSPWLSLVTGSHRNGIWRFPRFTGSPEILREVRMSDDPKLRGWHSGRFGESQSDVGIATEPQSPVVMEVQVMENGVVTDRFFRELSDPDQFPELANTTPATTALDWIWDEGNIIGRRNPKKTGAQGLLQYDRPLMSGEILNWEFAYSRGMNECHPVIGRLAFLLRPDGVALHWLPVDSGETLFLSADNEVVVPQDRRGPAALPLIQGWNKASLRIQGDAVMLSINDVDVYEHTLRPEDSRQFGLFYFRDQSELRVRNMVLTGDWPESLTAEHLQQLTASENEMLTASESQAMTGIAGETPYSAGLVEVIRFATSLTPDRRYEFLRQWVLPNDVHSDWRLFGAFAPENSSSGKSEFGADPWRMPEMFAGKTRHNSGFVVAPVIQLIRTAKEINQLSDLQLRAGAVSEPVVNSNDADSRGIQNRALCRLTVLFLIAIEEDRTPDAAMLMKQLRAILDETPVVSGSDVWPLLIVCQQSIHLPELRVHAIEILRHLTPAQPLTEENQASAQSRFISSAFATAELLQTLETDTGDIGPLKTWQPFRIVRADQCTEGLPAPVWIQRRDGTIQQIAGFEDDMLCYPVPITGNFEFQCELTPVDGQHLLVGYGDFVAIPSTDQQDVQKIPFGRDSIVGGKPRDVPDPDAVWQYRLAVADRTATVWINDQQVFNWEITGFTPPWLCIRAAAKPGARISNIRLRGEPKIPASIRLDTNLVLQGWSRPFFEGSEQFLPQSRAVSAWRSEEAILIGPKRESLAGTRSESLLQYFRPMLEDGTISYSFLYKSDIIAHPAMDRLAFILNKNHGVLLHPITNGAWDKSGDDPCDLIAEPAHQLVNVLPLREHDWNTMQVQLKGNTLTLILNDVEIYRRPLEASNRRTFGVFHYKDESSARVQQVNWVGQWPTNIPE